MLKVNKCLLKGKFYINLMLTCIIQTPLPTYKSQSFMKQTQYKYERVYRTFFVSELYNEIKRIDANIYNKNKNSD